MLLMTKFTSETFLAMVWAFEERYVIDTHLVVVLRTCIRCTGTVALGGIERVFWSSRHAMTVLLLL